MSQRRQPVQDDSTGFATIVFVNWLGLAESEFKQLVKEGVL